MQSRVEEKISDVKKFVSDLEMILPKTAKAYESDLMTKAACERYLEKITEAVIDVAFLVIRFKKFEAPLNDKNAFEVLEKHGVVSKEIAQKMKSAKGMRNLVVHDYADTDDEIVFETLSKELPEDAKKFVEEIELFLSKR